MSVASRAIIAALVGIAAGAIAGVWSLRQPAASVTVSASPVAAPAATTLVTATEAARARSNPVPPPADDDVQVVQRARALARRPDVTALMALRDDVVRRAAERGIADSSSIKSELDEIDLRLNEARLLQ